MSIHNKAAVKYMGSRTGKGAVYSSKMILSDGYLVEPRPDREYADKDGKILYESDGFNLIAVSMLSSKPRIEEFVKLLEEEDVYFQKGDRLNFDTVEDAYCVKKISRTDAFHKPLSMLETEQITRSGVTVTLEGSEEGVQNVLWVVRPEIESKVRIKGGCRARFNLFGTSRDLAIIRERAKIEGCTITEFRETTEGSLFKRCVFINPKCRPDDLDGDSKEAYLIGETREEARAQFWTILDCLTPPFQLEWETHIWTEFQRNGWVTELPGHRLFGYKLKLDQDLLLNMLSERIADDSLPNVIPEELELKLDAVAA